MRDGKPTKRMPKETFKGPIILVDFPQEVNVHGDVNPFPFRLAMRRCIKCDDFAIMFDETTDIAVEVDAG